MVLNMPLLEEAITFISCNPVIFGINPIMDLFLEKTSDEISTVSDL